MDRVKVQVEFEDIHATLSEEAPLAAWYVLGLERSNTLFAHAPLFGNAWNLRFGGRRRYLWIEARAGLGDEVCWNRSVWISRLIIVRMPTPPSAGTLLARMRHRAIQLAHS